MIPEDIFFKYVKAAFSNKRKNILNNLSTLGISKDEVREVLAKVGIAENERAENIDIETFIRLAKEFSNEEL
jgi:16S rRNA (adenine1518-N6/adenine1519-N6)-dimethyltransferase